MSRVGEVWDTGTRVFVVLEEDEVNAYAEESICFILIIYDHKQRGVGMTSGQWVPRREASVTEELWSNWKRIA